MSSVVDSVVLEGVGEDRKEIIYAKRILRDRWRYGAMGLGIGRRVGSRIVATPRSFLSRIAWEAVCPRGRTYEGGEVNLNER